MSYKTNRARVIDEVMERDGFVSCQHCGVNNSFKFHCHHIMFRSEKPNHQNLHDKQNLIILCNHCHDKFHGDKSVRNYLVKERNLKDLFN